MRKIITESSEGSSVIEAGVAILALSGFLSIVVGVLDVVGKSARVSKLVDWAIADTDARPFRLEGHNGDLEAGANVDHLRMRSYLEAVRRRTQEEFREEPYSLEVGYAVMTLNQNTGQVISLDDSHQYRLFSGQGAIPTNIEHCPELSQSFLELSDRTREHGGTVISEFAFPNGIGRGFQEQVAVVGMRLYWALGESYAGYVMNVMGKEEAVYSCKTAVLRGDVQ